MDICTYGSIAHQGLMVGEEVQRVCVATTHIPCSDSQQGLKKVGQVMALLAAARALLEKDQSMPFRKSRSLDMSSSSLAILADIKTALLTLLLFLHHCSIDWCL